MVSKSMQKVEITRTVLVNDRETLAAWLNQELEAWFNSCADETDFGGARASDCAGTKVLDLIEKAGFTLNSPTVPR